MLKTNVDAQRRLQAIFEQTAVGLAEVDLGGRFVLVNDRYCEMVGRPREELLGGLRMQDITHAEDLPANLERFGQLVADGTGFVIEKRYLRPDGSHVWVRNTVSRMDDPDGPSHVLAVAQDISEKVVAEAALRQRAKRREPQGSEFGFALPVMVSTVHSARPLEPAHTGAVLVSQE